MSEINTKSFKSGNSVAVRFPRSLGLQADVPLRIERDGDSYRLTPVVDVHEGRKRVAEMIAALNALPPLGEFQARTGVYFPERAWD